MNSLEEKIAEKEHEQWAHWTKHFLNHMNDGHSAFRWATQANTLYSDLSEQEKNADRAWAKIILDLVRSEYDGEYSGMDAVKECKEIYCNAVNGCPECDKGTIRRKLSNRQWIEFTKFCKKTGHTLNTLPTGESVEEGHE